MKDFFDTWKFKILVAVAVFLVGIMAYAGANGRLTAAPQELLGVVLMPLQKVTSALSGGIGSVWEKYTSIDEVMEQNEQLEAENAELRQQIVDYDRIKAENEAYKALARIQDSNTEASYISAFVIGRDPLDEFGGFTKEKLKRYFLRKIPISASFPTRMTQLHSTVRKKAQSLARVL